ncbi:hypothetical protein [Clostridium sp. UBA2485]|uniref:hypothetical protein n=1 Tax=Clostridium sp. UBA2485 TaxID=1946352 RepID=UPI0025C3906D|nr:hypothetical protein [Clostridium sp. UBA2485]
MEVEVKTLGGEEGVNLIKKYPDISHSTVCKLLLIGCSVEEIESLYNTIGDEINKREFIDFISTNKNYSEEMKQIWDETK